MGVDARGMKTWMRLRWPSGGGVCRAEHNGEKCQKLWTGEVLPLDGSLLTLQRHFNALPKFTLVESRLWGHKRQRDAAFHPSTNLCVRKHVHISVAVGLMGDSSDLF